MNTCPKCHGEFDEGRVSAGDQLSYVSNRQSGVLRAATQIHRARVCLACGYLELYLDAAKLKDRIQA